MEKELADCEAKWLEAQEELKSTPSFQNEFPELVGQMRLGLLRVLRNARKTCMPDVVDRTKNRILALLQDENPNKRLHIDDCVRWHILKAVAKNASSASRSGGAGLGANGDEADDEENDSLTLSKIIIKMRPYLAFENPSQDSASSEYRSIRGDCRDRGIHWAQKPSSTPFLEAAKAGNAAVIRHMIREGRDFLSTAISAGQHRQLFLPLDGSGGRRIAGVNGGVNASRWDNSNLLVQILRQKHSGFTALNHAALAEKGRAQTLEVLFAEAPGIAIPSDGTFERAIDKGVVDVVNTFLSHQDLREEFVSSGNMIRALAKIPDGRLDDKLQDPHVQILRSLLKHAKDAQSPEHAAHNSERPSRAAEAFDDKVVETIIERNLDAVWELEDRPGIIKPETYASLLHLAVVHQKLNFVRLFLKADPASVTRKVRLPKSDRFRSADKEKEYYALWHNNWVWKDSKEERRKGLKEIRTEIVKETIRQVSRMQTLSSIFQESGEKVAELSFDLSRFDSKVYKVSEFVQSLINHHENEDILSYEPTIRYAEFPALDLNTEEKKTYGDNVYLPYEHTEVVKALYWLRFTKKVERIIELRVPDRMINPHNELVIAQYAKDFQVEVLDWRFLDLSLSVLHDEVKGRIRELHLYSSGRWAAVRHWLSDQGIITLPKLSSLYIYVVKEMMTENACIKFANDVRAEFSDLWKKWPHKDAMTGEKFFEKPKVLRKFWNPTQQKLPDLAEIAQRVVPTLSRFIQGYRRVAETRQQEDEKRFQREEAERKQRGEGERRRKEDDPRAFHPVKVAIIDNGILSISPQPQERPFGAGADPRGPKAGRQDSNSNETASDVARLAALQNAAEQEDQDHTEGGRTLWSRIKGGQSFVDDESKVSPWLFASHPHGTQMANLICAIDPMCQLYVAKVADGKYGTTALRVQKAIKWARDQKVDIISMSFTITEMTSGLHREIKDADDEGILMLCSTHDEGYNIAKAYPADHKLTTTIAACDEYGGLLRSLEDTKYDFAFYGSNVAAGKIPFVESTDRITGSSAATAIAAGLSSLLLSCEQLAFPEGPPKTDKQRPHRVRDYLNDKMLSGALDKSGKPTKYVVLSKFGGIDSSFRDGEDTYTPGTEHIYANKILAKHFRDYFSSTKTTPGTLNSRAV